MGIIKMTIMCSRCLQELFESDFSIARNNVNGLSGRCRECVKEEDRGFYRRIGIMYKSQVLSSKRRKHALPNYTKDEFTVWCIQNNYAVLHENWKNSNYLKRDTPSADRLDDSLPYTLQNLQLITWGANDDKAHSDFKSGKLINTHTPVHQFSKTGEYITTYPSQKSAARAVGSTQGNIGMVCRGERKHAKGFLWSYA